MSLKLGIVKWISRLLILIVLALGLCVYKAPRARVGFYLFVTTWPCSFFGDCTNYSILSMKRVKIEANP